MNSLEVHACTVQDFLWDFEALKACFDPAAEGAPRFVVVECSSLVCLCASAMPHLTPCVRWTKMTFCFLWGWRRDQPFFTFPLDAKRVLNIAVCLWWVSRSHPLLG